MQSDVLIIGAGPSGLTAAVTLARYGVRPRIVDREGGPPTDSRATIVHSRTLEIWDKLGFADQALAGGVRVDRAALMRDGREFALLPFSGAEDGLQTPYPFSVVFEQPKSVRMMVGDLKARGYAVEWGTSLVALEQDSEGVMATLERAGGLREVVRARWVIACDGAHSRARSLLGLDFSGHTHEQLAFIADADLEAPPEYRGRVNLNYFREGYVGIVPLACEDGRRYRIFGVVPEELEERLSAQWKSGVRPEDLTYIFRERLRTPVRVLRSMDTGLYRLHRRMVPRYRVGRCFLAGDAAHIHTPAGGQGMNTGIQDAHNLAWKLALVLREQAAEALLDSYETERSAVAKTVLRGTDIAFVVEATKNPLLQLFNNHVVPRIVRIGSRFEAFRRMGSRIFIQAWMHYRDSQAVAAGRAERGPVRPGDRAPEGPFEQGAETGGSLFAKLRGVEHHLLVFEGLEQGPALEGLVKRQREALAASALPTRVHPVSRGNHTLHVRYGARRPSVFLLRPDGHVAFVGDADAPGALTEYLRRWFPAATA